MIAVAGVIVIIGAAYGIKARLRRCKHVGISFHGMPSSALQECPDCSEIVEFGDVHR